MSTLFVNRIEPRTGDTVEIVGFGGGGVSNIHMSYTNGDQTLTNGTWTRVIHNVNSAPNPRYNSSTGIYTVGSGEGGIYYTNWNCAVVSTVSAYGLKYCASGVYVNDSRKLENDCDYVAGYSDFAVVPSTGILKLADGDEVTIYALGTPNSSNNVKINGQPGIAINSWTMFKIGESS